MNKYIIELPLEHNTNTNSKLDGYSSHTSIEINLMKICEFKFEIYNENLRHENYVQIENRNDNKILLRFKDIYGESESEAIIQLKQIIDKICYCISFISQRENPNSHNFDIKFQYDITNCKVKCINSDCPMEPRVMRISCKHVYTIDLDKLDFQEIFNKSLNNKNIEFLIETYYKSLGNIECTSRYYNLFSMIEFLETNYASKIKYSTIFSIEQKNKFLGKTKSDLNEIFEDNEIINRMYGRIAQIISTATLESRKEKLYKIITEYLDIKYITIGNKKLYVTIDMIDNFIKKRNGLFHAKHIDDKEKSELEYTTNNLMILGGEIIMKLLKEPYVNITV